MEYMPREEDLILMEEEEVTENIPAGAVELMEVQAVEVEDNWKLVELNRELVVREEDPLLQ
ncbi:hypothetical protein ES708_27640 [subsurface metagenome]